MARRPESERLSVCGASVAALRRENRGMLGGRGGSDRGRRACGGPARSCQPRTSGWLPRPELRRDPSRGPPETGGESRFQTSEPPGTAEGERPGGLDPGHS